jgi:hypothetical protein
MEGENAFWAVRASVDGFFHLTLGNAVAIADVHLKSLKAIAN